MVMRECPFCERLRFANVSSAGGMAVAFADRFPVADGHMLVVPRRHLPRLEDLPVSEWQDVFELVRETARELVASTDVDGVNVGVNSGAVAGQTVEHAHVHVIPRRFGDVPDPRGGVRHVIPNRADYWNSHD
jgi:diadenosine tetraphosphate (Ap4A) HIT family hydrolase